MTDREAIETLGRDLAKARETIARLTKERDEESRRVKHFGAMLRASVLEHEETKTAWVADHKEVETRWCAEVDHANRYKRERDTALADAARLTEERDEARAAWTDACHQAAQDVARARKAEADLARLGLRRERETCGTCRHGGTCTNDVCPSIPCAIAAENHFCSRWQGKESKP